MGLDIDWLHLDLLRLRDGSLANRIQESGRRLTFCGIDCHSRPIVGNAKVGWEVDLWKGFYVFLGCSPELDSALRAVNAIQASLNDWMRSGRPTLLYSMRKACENAVHLKPFSEESSEPSIPSYAVVVSAVILLSLVYQYLTGTADIGSSKAYSRSSLDFRDIYVAIVLFLGAYVWIKFREVACKGVHKKEVKDKHGRLIKVVYEPRFKPPRENGRVFEWVYLGQYATPEEASILYQIAAFLYNEGQGGSLALADGRLFSIPPTSEGDRSLTGADKRAWVKVQAMKVYKDFEEEKAKEKAALLVHEYLENEVHVPFSIPSFLNPDEHQQPALVNQVENLGMDMAVPADQGLEWESSQSVGRMHEDLGAFTGHSAGLQEDSARRISQPTPDTQSGLNISSSSALFNYSQIVHNQQELIKYFVQQVQERDTQIQERDAQIQERDAQISVLQNEKGLDRQQLEESRFRISELESQHFAEQQLKFIDEVDSNLEMERSM